MDNQQDILFTQLKKAAEAIHQNPSSDAWEKIQRKKERNKLKRILLLTLSMAACLAVVFISVQNLQNTQAENTIAKSSYQLTPLQDIETGRHFFNKSNVNQLFVSYQKANLIQKN